LVPVESLYAASHYWIIVTCLPSHTISEVSGSIGQTFAVRGGSINALVQRELLNSRSQYLVTRN